MLSSPGHYYNPLLLPRQDDPCVKCPDTIPPCNCKAGQICERVTKTCSACAANICVDDPSSSKKSTGVSSSTLAGAIVACVVVVAVVVAAFFFYRRRMKAKKVLEEKAGELQQQQFAAAITPRSVHDVPPASPLRSPRSPAHPSSPTLSAEKKLQLVVDPSNGVQVIEPNPFSDSASVTTSNSSNVIPIAYVPPNSDGRALSPTQQAHIPARPTRSPELNLRLPPNSLSGNTLPVPKGPAYPQSTKSGVSGFSSRSSIMSSASSFIYDSPTIVTSAQGRQVLGVVRAEVVQVPATPGVPPLPSGARGHHLLPVSRARASAAAVGRSPLGAVSIRREDIEMEVESMPSPSSPESPNPFSDRKAATRLSANLSTKSTTTFGSPQTKSPLLSPREYPLPDSRPGSSMADQNSQASAPPTPRHDGTFSHHSTPTQDTFPVETPAADLTTQPIPSDGERDSVLIRHALGGGIERPWRNSQASFVTTGSRADSILASFPFVPPSPAGPAFSQPSTPRNVSSFARGHGYTASQSTVGDFSEYQLPMHGPDTPPVPKVPSGIPGRRANAFSTMSGASTASSGLDAFTFHFGSGVPLPSSGADNGGIGQHPLAQSSTASLSSIPPGLRRDLDRASLDTMVLSRDLEAYPLAFDRPQKL